MPRNNEDVYQLPPNSFGQSGQVISSIRYNAAIEDFQGEFNTARPIKFGGTGAATAADARTNLGVISAADVTTQLDLKLDKTGGELTGDLTGEGATFTAINGPLTGDVNGDVTGNLTGNVTGDLTGNATTATQLATSRDFSMSGPVTAVVVSFDGTGNVVLNTSIADNALTIAKTSGLQTALNQKANLSNPTFTGQLASTRIRATSVAVAALGTTNHPLQIGVTANENLVFSNRLIQARNNGAAAPLRLNPFGGDVQIFGNQVFHEGNFIPASKLDATGTAVRATRLAALRDFSLTGTVTASAVGFDGSGNVMLNTSVSDGALTIAKVAGLQTALDNAGTAGPHTHPIGEVVGLQDALDDKSDTTHGHGIAAISGLQTALDGKSDTTHGHGISNITGLQTALDGKAETSHVHTIANITGLQTALNGKANSNHTHTIANVTGLQTALNGKANSSHTHTIAQVTGLQTALDAKEDTLDDDQKRKITFSTSAPTGGADGDIWLEHEA